MKKTTLFILLTFVLILSCSNISITRNTPSQVTAESTSHQDNTATDSPEPIAMQPTSTNTQQAAEELPEEPALTETSIPTVTIQPTEGPTPTLWPNAWKDMPVIPEQISETTRAIYKVGQLMGNDPNAFSKIGDCNSTNPYFLTDFDSPGIYKLGEYEELQETIDYFTGSFERESLAAKIGLSSGAALTVLWADWKECNSTETPLDCEFRVHNPSFAIISVGTNDVTDKASMEYFEDKMRRVLDATIGKGIVPILATKADNIEGDFFINDTIARLAYEYDIPLWNFWLAVQPLSGYGLQEDKPEHLTIPNDWSMLCSFENADNMDLAFPVRNLTALQVLDAVRKGIVEGE